MTKESPIKKIVDSRFTDLERKNLTLLGIVITMCLITFGIIAAYGSWDDSDTVEENARINVNYVYVKESRENTDDQTYTLNLNIFLTNREDEKAKDVHIEVAGIDHTSKLTYAIGETDVGDIEGKNTLNVSVEITIPIVKTYKMQLMVFQDDTIKVKGYRIDTINITQSGPRDDFKVTYNQETTRRVIEKGDEDISDLTYFILYLFIIVLVIQLYFVIRLMDFAALRSAIMKLMKIKKK
jgi:hypothetical protein